MPFSAPQDVKDENIGGDSWLKPSRFAALLALLVLASYPQIIFGIQAFVYRDFGCFSYPIAWHFRESFWRGEIPLWNPLSDCGTPFLAQWNTQVLYPPALFYLLLPLSWSLGVFCLLHLYLGGLGMFFLAQRWTQNHFAAAFAGIAFAFNGLMLNSLAWPATIAGLAWMPWVVWLAERAACKGGNKIIIAAMVGALQMLSGAVEVVLLTWTFIAVLGLTELFRGETPRGKIILRLSLVVLLVSGLCAAQLLPFFDLLNYSRRQETVDISQWPMPPTGWLNFFAPLFRCRAYQGVFMQDNQFWISSYYVGVTTVVMAIWATCRLRDASVRLMAALILFCLVLALGDATPLYNWLNRCVAVVGLMRFPIKFIILPVFLLPLLAARNLAGTKKSSVWRWFWVWIAAVILMTAILGWNHFLQQPDDDRRAVFLNGLSRMIFFTAIIGGLFLLEKNSGLGSRRWLQVSLLLLVWLDLYHHEPLPQTVNRGIYQPNLLHSSVPYFGVARAMLPSGTRDQLDASLLSDASQEYIRCRITLVMNCNLLDNIPKCDGFFPLYLAGHVALDSADLPGPLLDFLGVSQTLIVQTNTLYWKPRSNFMPLLTGGQKPVFAGDEMTLRLLADPNFNPRREIYLPPEAQKIISATNGAAVKISSARFTGEQIEAEVQADAPAMFAIAQTYYHPWRAYVDGKPARLWRANFAFQALEIPAGPHHVKLAYEDRRFYCGAIISLTTLSGCLIFYCFQRRMTHRRLPDSGGTDVPASRN